MSVRKFLTLLPTGKQKLMEAIISSAGAIDQFKIIALGANGRLHQSMMPEGVGANTLTKTASENLAAGDLVNLWDDGGTPSVRKADAGVNRREAFGFVLDSVVAGNPATVYKEGSNITGLTGLTIGALYFLSNSTPGGVSTTPPDITTDTGHIVQPIGIADTATSIPFEVGVATEIG